MSSLEQSRVRAAALYPKATFERQGKERHLVGPARTVQASPRHHFVVVCSPGSVHWQFR